MTKLIFSFLAPPKFWWHHHKKCLCQQMYSDKDVYLHSLKSIPLLYQKIINNRKQMSYRKSYSIWNWLIDFIANSNHKNVHVLLFVEWSANISVSTQKYKWEIKTVSMILDIFECMIRYPNIVLSFGLFLSVSEYCFSITLNEYYLGAKFHV